MTFSTLPSGLVEAIGAAGAALTTLCWLPQATKIIRDRDTRAISLPGTTLCVIGVLLWLIYGLAIVDSVLNGALRPGIQGPGLRQYQVIRVVGVGPRLQPATPGSVCEPMFEMSNGRRVPRGQIAISSARA